MTREEAIHIVDMAFNIPLAVRRSGEDRTYHEAEIREAKRMAIEALKQELCDDAVSRQAVDKLIDELARAISDERCFMSRGRSTATIMQDILDLPSVSTEKTGRWIPIERELPELNKPLLVTAYHRVCYAHMISKSGNYGYPVFRLHELKDSDRGWVQETISHEPYSKGRIDAWMYIDIPQPYKAESEE